MTIIRAQVTFSGGTQLPEDKYVNTFHFDSGGASMSSVTAGLTTQLAFFYNGVATNGQVSDIASRMSIHIRTPVVVKFYDLGQSEPRVPIETTFNLDARGGDGAPEECCAVLSYRAALPNTPRRRGRIYIGPLSTTSFSLASATVPTRLTTAFTSDLTRAGAALAGNVATSVLCTWVVYSTASGGVTFPVAHLHADNAIDTQRRRGADATARQSMPV